MTLRAQCYNLTSCLYVGVSQTQRSDGSLREKEYQSQHKEMQQKLADKVWGCEVVTVLRRFFVRDIGTRHAHLWVYFTIDHVPW